MNLIGSLALIILALIALTFCAERFIDKAELAAVRFGLPDFVIGALILGLGTSAPEMIVSVLSALDDAPQLALGNAIGSNIANIALVLGATLLIARIPIERGLLRVDLPVLLVISGLLALFMWDLSLSRFEGVLLILLMAGYLIYSLMQPGDTANPIPGSEPATKTSLAPLLLIAGIWLIGMLLSSQLLVSSSISVAQALGVSELIIGLTIVAIGTSMPELVASISAARRGNTQLALGNIIGSNLFNTLGVIGLAVVIRPFRVPELALSRDLLVCIALSAVLLILCFSGYRKKGSIGKKSGMLLLLSFAAFNIVLIYSAE